MLAGARTRGAGSRYSGSKPIGETATPGRGAVIDEYRRDTRATLEGNRRRRSFDPEGTRSHHTDHGYRVCPPRRDRPRPPRRRRSHRDIGTSQDECRLRNSWLPLELHQPDVLFNPRPLDEQRAAVAADARLDGRLHPPYYPPSAGVAVHQRDSVGRVHQQVVRTRDERRAEGARALEREIELQVQPLRLTDPRR